ncbi:MAG: D-cysteine desulfhydrase family protein [Pseudomonadota bacterium]
MSESPPVSHRGGLTSAYPHARLGHFPTPLEPMPRLAAALGSPERLWVKRDDCTGLALGGNKVRQLEYYLGAALELGATRILITGAVQSNYVRTAAAAAAKLGLACTVQLEDRVRGKDELYRRSGNVLLDHLLGADVVLYPEGEDEAGADAALEQMAAAAATRGERPYVVHLSEQPRPLGALGYVAAAEELFQQAAHIGLDIGTLVVSSGSAVTHAGVLVGVRALGYADVQVVGACVRRDAGQQSARVLRVAASVASMLSRSVQISADDVTVDDTALAPGYGQLNPQTRHAMSSAATLEGLIVDPVYTGKCFAVGMDWYARDTSDRATVLWHTGGTPALFAYGQSVLSGA